MMHLLDHLDTKLIVDFEFWLICKLGFYDEWSIGLYGLELMYLSDQNILLGEHELKVG